MGCDGKQQTGPLGGRIAVVTDASSRVGRAISFTSWSGTSWRFQAEAIRMRPITMETMRRKLQGRSEARKNPKG